MIRAEMTIREASTIRALNSMAGTVVQQRDLELLNSIDETIDALCERRAACEVLINGIEGAIEGIKNSDQIIDPDGKIGPMLEETRDRLGEIHATWSRKCEIARTAPELRPDDGVVEAYCEALDSVAHLHNVFNELMWAIGEHDADFDKPVAGGPYTNAEDLIAALEA